MEQRKSEIQVLKEVQRRGYTDNLIISDGMLYANEVKGEGLQPEDCIVEEEYRFEGMSNPSDMSILYAVSAPGGVKGSIVVNYGPQVDHETAQFFRRINYAQMSE